MESNYSKVFFLIITFIFVANFAIFGLFLVYGLFNDYIMYNIVETSIQLENSGISPSTVQQQVMTIAEAFRDNVSIYDNAFFIIYIGFILATIVASYRAKKENFFSAFGFLFFIGMLFLFMLSIFTAFSEWWNVQILEPMLPTVMTILPKYGWYLDHVGLVSFIQLCACVVINLVDFDLAGIFNRKKKEQAALEEDESTQDVL